MTRNLGLTSGLRSGGIGHEGRSPRDAIRPRDSFHASGATFKRSGVLQALIDVLAVVSAAVLVFVTGLGLFTGLFFLLFVRI